MVMIGMFFLAFFPLIWYLNHKDKLENKKWLLLIAIVGIPLAYICSECGWIVAEVGRQPWVIQDIMPTYAAVSNIDASSVKLTFTLFAVLFTVLLSAELRILYKQIKKGPENTD